MSYGNQGFRSNRTQERFPSDRRQDGQGGDSGGYGEDTGRGYGASRGWGEYGDASRGRNGNREDDSYGSRSFPSGRSGQWGNDYGRGNGRNAYGRPVKDDGYGANNRGGTRNADTYGNSQVPGWDIGYGGSNRSYGNDGGYGGNNRRSSNGSGYRGNSRGQRSDRMCDVMGIQLEREDYSYLEEFDRTFYYPSPIVNSRSIEEVTAIRRSLDITVDPPDCIAPVTSFEEAFETNQPPGDGPMALILAPTRELSIQIHEECEKFGRPCGVKTTVVYGGAKRAPQIRELRQGIHLLVATPGRLLDVLESRDTNLRRVTYFVLDEADRMLDMGFEPQIMQIVDQIRPDRQTVLWSATWPQDVEEIAGEIVQRPYKVTIGANQLRANHNITQKFQILGGYERKIDRLMELLSQQEGHERILIFCGTKRSVDSVTTQLRQTGFGALAIHGDKEQPEREWVLEEFRRGSSPIMVATDVAQRGLDIKDVYCVVNYDMPNTGEDYVHRIGRTGRAGRRGLSVSFFTPDDARVAKSIVRVLQEAGQQVAEELLRFADNNLSEPMFRGGRGNGGLRRTGANAVAIHHGWSR